MPAILLGKLEVHPDRAVISYGLFNIGVGGPFDQLAQFADDIFHFGRGFGQMDFSRAAISTLRGVDPVAAAFEDCAVAAMGLDNALLVYRNALKLSHISSNELHHAHSQYPRSQDPSVPLG